MNDIPSFKIILIFQMKHSLKLNFLFESDEVGNGAGELAKKAIGIENSLFIMRPQLLARACA